jgi:hypothetical protein
MWLTHWYLKYGEMRFFENCGSQETSMIRKSQTSINKFANASSRSSEGAAQGSTK